MATNYSNGGVIGPNFDTTHTTAKFPLGTRVQGPDNQVWIYVQASAAIGQYRLVSIDKDFAATTCTAALLATPNYLGVTQIAIAASSYGWVPINGSNLYCLIDGTADVNPGALLTVSPLSAAAGLLALNSISTQEVIAGIRTVTTVSGATETSEVVLNNPHAFLGRS